MRIGQDTVNRFLAFLGLGVGEAESIRGERRGGKKRCQLRAAYIDGLGDGPGLVTVPASAKAVEDVDRGGLWFFADPASATSEQQRRPVRIGHRLLQVWQADAVARIAPQLLACRLRDDAAEGLARLGEGVEVRRFEVGTDLADQFER